MRKSFALTLVVTTAALWGCGGGLSKEEMAQAWTATAATLSQGEAMAHSGGALTHQTADLDMTFDYSCVGGGTATFDGNYGVTGTTGSYSGSFDFDVAYAGCSTSGITIDGNLSYDASYSGSTGGMTGSYVYDMVYQGSLTFSGDVTGTCDVDLTYHYELSYGTGANYDISYSGSICGYDATDLTVSGSYNF